MAKKKDKAKRQKFISRITEDRTVSKKEGRKAAKKGVTLNQIRSGYIDAFRARQKEFADRPGPVRERQPFAQAPSYQPLKIKGGAERALTKKMKPSGTKDKGKKDVVAPVAESEKTKLSPEQKQIGKLEKRYDKLFGRFEKTLGKLKDNKSSIKDFYKRQMGKLRAESSSAVDTLNQYISDQKEAAAAQLEQDRLDREEAELSRSIFMQNQMRAASAIPQIQFGAQSPRAAMSGTSQFRRRSPYMTSIVGGINI